jgi:hypothetical protein
MVFVLKQKASTKSHREKVRGFRSPDFIVSLLFC